MEDGRHVGLANAAFRFLPQALAHAAHHELVVARGLTPKGVSRLSGFAPEGEEIVDLQASSGISSFAACSFPSALPSA